ncbi:alkylation response protein AidB-like acyl-CoA dehydrogenase [Kitasatospora gansuensis]|uniref:Alkylation response protein AidB-like acyl-CoA dehydrogenase n=1 Tax=Kitasatospora gansuensis TaxID=258050 RepID=A0A7W7SHQ0_9ACTN|nr:acyl-CoA dehydrogenase [Kitasatospora gansuensis]MBB4950093.1 alkylation response protein AidB-like acyl-CoA dehydrogenase [Kitasatospora gansuensis]
MTATAATAAEELDRELGDPADAANPFGYAAAVGRDERDEFPEELCAVLRKRDFHLNYLPAELGGSFRSFDHSLTLVRTAARRDLNVMPGTMFSITAATCVLLHGSTAQQERVAAILRRGGSVAFAMSEAEHGSDLLANTARLTPAGDGRELSGTKWMVGLGHRSEAAYLVARTGERGPAAFSAILLDLDDRVGRGARVPTGGMRGIDFAHLTFDRHPVPADALVGRDGEALETAVKAQQVVRLMSTAGSLGCADTALRLTLDFAAGRRIGRTELLDSPYPQRELAIASAALLAADAVALAAARGIHVAPESFSVWGCAAKHVVAEAVEDLMLRCGTVLATRSVLRTEGPGGGLFQKLQRDAALVRVVDTSTVANLRSFAGQLPALLGQSAEPDPTAVRAVFDLAAELPPYEPARLDLNARGRDLVTGGPLPEAEGSGQATRLRTALAGLPAELAWADPKDNGLVDLAERFAWLHAATACLHLHAANRDDELLGRTDWLDAVLGYLLARADGTSPRRSAGPLLPALAVTRELHAANRLFSAVPVQLA